MSLVVYSSSVSGVPHCFKVSEETTFPFRFFACCCLFRRVRNRVVSRCLSPCPPFSPRDIVQVRPDDEDNCGTRGERSAFFNLLTFLYLRLLIFA